MDEERDYAILDDTLQINYDKMVLGDDYLEATLGSKYPQQSQSTNAVMYIYRQKTESDNLLDINVLREMKKAEQLIYDDPEFVKYCFLKATNRNECDS